VFRSVEEALDICSGVCRGQECHGAGNSSESDVMAGGEPGGERQHEGRGDGGHGDIAREQNKENPDAENDEQGPGHEREQTPAVVAMPLPPLKPSQQVSCARGSPRTPAVIRKWFSGAPRTHAQESEPRACTADPAFRSIAEQHPEALAPCPDRKALVAPMLPLPTVRHVDAAGFATKNPVGIEPRQIGHDGGRNVTKNRHDDTL